MFVPFTRVPGRLYLCEMNLEKVSMITCCAFQGLHCRSANRYSNCWALSTTDARTAQYMEPFQENSKIQLCPQQFVLAHLAKEQASPVRQILFCGAMAPTLLPVRPGPHLTVVGLL